ncbi:MAG TPA: tRNA cyclic N6-threonylcarbamoyladenosine(37) synthase TcdA [Noviherbaspirillum sp.]|uniref:tRNA cyclic N6-threonylcarbamoyladenosine(37) synthase TcdA n=1 Tax=Noviherbaspirillum sp. TaxID=1926288 RepID=UPI002D61AFF5|nr:tRNA cyclic N6-threonylcarbamoyladenosine(37) synthase TcdA [Noviherbaspirillum sp.]HYD96637.1 tRNA cyclic N6-threonylcarbamoyladenosine(37) synthase TcdA [Noviherbaspirillum sp.]
MNAVVSLPPLDFSSDNDIDFDRRFGGIARLYGDAGLARFRAAHVCVIGVGGVGSWVVEALARSAIGRITMIDLDNVAESNVNRQIHALTDTLGKAKVTALAERIGQINPYCSVTEIEDFITPENLDEMIGAGGYDYVIDAIDSVKAKTALIAYCRYNGIRLITIGGAGGQTDPTKIEIRDLSRTEQEPLLAKVRKRLRAQHGFPRGMKNKFGIDAVFSTEPLLFPGSGEACSIDAGDAGDGDGNANGEGKPGITGLNCAGFGSSMVVTASFGLVAAAQVLRKLAGEAQAAGGASSLSAAG